MKIVDRKAFLKFPSGTLFVQCYEPWAWGDIHVKYDSLIYDESGDGDFVSATFSDIWAKDSGDLFDKWEDMHLNGASYPLSLDCASRDGIFERNALFLIYEQQDVEALRDFFTNLAQQTRNPQ